MQQQVSLKQILFGEYIPPPVTSVRRVSLMDDPVPVAKCKPKKIMDTSTNKARLAAMTEATRNRMLETVRKFPGGTVESLAGITGLSRTTVSKSLKYLVENSRVYYKHETLAGHNKYVHKYYPVKERHVQGI